MHRIFGDFQAIIPYVRRIYMALANPTRTVRASPVLDGLVDDTMQSTLCVLAVRVHVHDV